MQYRQLGTTGIFVSRLCLGAMTFGGPENAISNAIGRLSLADTDRIVAAALDDGINFIDTADVYGAGASESLLGDVLKGRRNDVVLATKASGRVGPGPNDVGQSRLHIMQALEASLGRLKTDHIDLYQIHNFDRLTPLEETLGALDDAVRQGKVRYIGCSNLAAWQVMKALGISERRLLARFVSVQAYYSLAGRDVERELVPAIADQGLGLLCWSPLAGGLLSGKFDRSGATEKGSRRDARGVENQFPPVDEAQAFDIIDVLKEIAGRHGASAAQVALAWLLAQPAVTSVIIGVKRVDQLADNLAAIDLELTEDDLASLDTVSRTAPTYPGWMQSYRARARVPGGHPFDGPSWGPGDGPFPTVLKRRPA
ncbi:MAG TPA: aldo/keto reductase [Stellaceae bacterium]|nr:aldo/keto reductase [Stellaceae bacterium]